MGRLGGDDEVPGLQSPNDDQPLQAHPCPISPRSHRSGPHLNSFVGILCESGKYPKQISTLLSVNHAAS